MKKIITLLICFNSLICVANNYIGNSSIASWMYANSGQNKLISKYNLTDMIYQLCPDSVWYDAGEYWENKYDLYNYDSLNHNINLIRTILENATSIHSNWNWLWNEFSVIYSDFESVRIASEQISRYDSEINELKNDVDALKSAGTTGDSTWLDPNQWRVEFVIEKPGGDYSIEIKAIDCNSYIYAWDSSNNPVLYVGHTSIDPESADEETELWYYDYINWITVGRERDIREYYAGASIYDDSSESSNMLFYIGLSDLLNRRGQGTSWFRPFATNVVWVYGIYDEYGNWDGEWHIITPNWVRSNSTPGNIYQ